MTTSSFSNTPVPPRAAETLRQLAQVFEAKFGRPPGPDDPLPFDPEADVPQPLSPAKTERLWTRAAERAGLDGAAIYAMQHTGVFASLLGYGRTDGEAAQSGDAAEFEAARERYARLHGQDG